NQPLTILRDERGQDLFCYSQVARIEPPQDAFEITRKYLPRAAELLVSFKPNRAGLISRVVKVVTHNLQLRRIDSSRIADVLEQASQQLRFISASDCLG